MTSASHSLVGAALGIGATALVHAFAIGSLILLVCRLIQDATVRRGLLRLALIAPLVTTAVSIALANIGPPAMAVVGDSGGAILHSPASAPSPLVVAPGLLESEAAGTAISADGPGMLESLPPKLGLLLVVGWLVGAFSLLGRHLLSRRRLVRALEGRRLVVDGRARQILDEMVRRSRRCGAIRLTANRVLQVPVAIGVREISLPEAHLQTCTDTALRAVLAHELAHLETADTVWRLTASILADLLWCNPVPRLIASKLTDADEEVADERAIQLTDDRLGLARSILHFAEYATTIPEPVIPYTGRPSRAVARVARVLLPVEAWSVPRRWAATAASLWLLAIAAVQLPALEAPPLRFPQPALPVSATRPPSWPLPTPTHSDRVSLPPRAEPSFAATRTERSNAPEPRLTARARYQVAVSIGLEEPADGLERLRPLLHDSVNAVRRAATWALGEYSRSALESAGLSSEFARLAGDTDTEIRRQAAASIGIHEIRSGVGAVTGLLDDPSAAVVATAIWALGEFGDSELLRPALRHGVHPEPVVRKAVAAALARRPNLDWNPLLDTLTGDVDPQVRAFAGLALRKLNPS